MPYPHGNMTTRGIWQRRWCSIELTGILKPKQLNLILRNGKSLLCLGKRRRWGKGNRLCLLRNWVRLFSRKMMLKILVFKWMVSKNWWFRVNESWDRRLWINMFIDFFMLICLLLFIIGLLLVKECKRLRKDWVKRFLVS